jgi:hypothetical protein
MRVKGRHWVLLWLGLFLVVAGVVIARTSAAYRLSAELSRLRNERRTLEARRANLEGRIRAASSRQLLTDRARGFGLRQAEDSEIFHLGRPADSGQDVR